MEPSEYISKEGFDNSVTKLLPKRSTVIAITGATLGQVSLLEIESCTNQSVIGVYEQGNLFEEYIYLKFKEIIQQVIKRAGGAAQQHINKEIVDTTKILVPPKESAEKFTETVKPIFDMILNLLSRNLNLRRTRDLLLPKLISGEVAVESILLEGNE